MPSKQPDWIVKATGLHCESYAIATKNNRFAR